MIGPVIAGIVVIKCYVNWNLHTLGMHTNLLQVNVIESRCLSLRFEAVTHPFSLHRGSVSQGTMMTDAYVGSPLAGIANDDQIIRTGRKCRIHCA